MGIYKQFSSSISELIHMVLSSGLLCGVIKLLLGLIFLAHHSLIRLFIQLPGACTVVTYIAISFSHIHSIIIWSRTTNESLWPKWRDGIFVMEKVCIWHKFHMSLFPSVLSYLYILRKVYYKSHYSLHIYFEANMVSMKTTQPSQLCHYSHTEPNTVVLI